MGDYEIRRYGTGDRDEFLSLYATVMGERKGTEWFDWKYGANPYVDHVAMFVAVTDGTIVGARPFVALPVRIDGERDVVLQPADAIVHPDHRRRGLFTRMTEHAIERYAGDHPFFFNFPNHRSLPGNLDLGWRIVSERSAYYRIANPVRVVRARTDRTGVQVASRIGAPIARGYYGLRDLTASTPPTAAIRTVTEPPAAALAALYRRSVPAGIHAVRDEEFYRWRLDNPDWEYTTYVAEERGEPRAAIVTGTAVESSLRTTKLTDVVPLGTAPKPLLETLIHRILQDRAETDLFVAPSQGIPASVLGTFGFHPDAAPPLSFVSTRTTHVVRSLADDRERTGTDLGRPDSWLMTFIERDTS
ncbi:GNAT family N-acetyltransferase [Halopenitus persicus]|uniref:GNAT family N-acetyltransferase n=1 Tax=Halopenitus persicus TaxID=1048396 RepID=UPI0012FE0FD3|nr:GNAT family N-acetyltransferase [Halopenitus persicus]